MLYVGISDAPAWWIAQANTLADLQGWSPFIGLQIEVPVIPILGARKLAQLEDNLASLDLALSSEQLKALDKASRIELGFPGDLYTNEMARASAYGGMRDQILA